MSDIVPAPFSPQQLIVNKLGNSIVGTDVSERDIGGVGRVVDMEIFLDKGEIKTSAQLETLYNALKQYLADKGVAVEAGTYGIVPGVNNKGFQGPYVLVSVKAEEIAKLEASLRKLRPQQQIGAETAQGKG